MEYLRIRRALSMTAGSTSDYDLNAGAPRIATGRAKPASVLMPLIERSGEVHVILTKRAGNLKNHAGQISFPGGKADPEDRNSLATALREAQEEIGLATTQVRILGRCAQHRTSTGFVVTPFVGVVTLPFVAQPLASEVDEVFEVPFNYLLNPKHYRIERKRIGGFNRRYYVSEFENRYIWGATARILFELASRMAAA
ncbi:MAG: CoA pyrophosphatase [Rhodobacteraceae bacterium]|nr:CoA pyrophosphatase [Paracoccaceae bacterium]